MNKTEILIIILGCGFLIYLIREAFQVRADRKKLVHVVYVNGTRGKSTVTRMIAVGLSAGGYKVMCKTTGTLPIAIYPDGREEEVKRRGPANIREQIKYLHIAAEEGADCLVIECMALQPEYQRVSGKNMLHCDVGVITNARLDHMDVMGDTREEILSCLMEMLPEKGLVFSAEKDLAAMLKARAEKLESRFVLSDEQILSGLSGAAELDFPENTALALTVCEGLGVSCETAYEGVRHFSRDPYALAVFQNGNVTFANALSANDVASTKLIYERVRGSGDEELVILINNRSDRPARAADMARLVREMSPKEVWILGEDRKALAGLCRKAAPSAVLRDFALVEEIPLSAESPRLILAVGNIKNEGIRLFERVSREMPRKEAGRV